MTGIVSVDIEFRGKDYRIAEPARSLGASIRPAARHVSCGQCARKIAEGAPHYRSGNGLTVRCLRCAIRESLLTPLDLETRFATFQASRA